ncbi:extensin family protein [Aliiroseovarius sp. S2029]|uniref:extensin-like domain-containing protein n=1 Tax=Aliiroseovarius sp. S2029 TaxID=2936988 RepID=UPI0020BF2B13|nr:extensin family protein [Aliiroseovarius sp. S2029]MCK8483588.1 extensin family protein [Aliiroseovarius sp. S2029]
MTKGWPGQGLWRGWLMGMLLGCSFGMPAIASAPETSQRPEPRPDTVTVTVIRSSGSAASDKIERPQVRRRVQTHASATRAVAEPTAFAVRRSLRPNLRPKGLARKIAALTPKPVNSGRRGRICGVNEIKGQAISAIPGRIRGCGVSDPVRVTEVSGVKLSQPAVMDCTTAKALNKWVRDGVFPSVGRLGGGPATLRVAAHYACRTRNNQPGAKVSEHGRGRAIDISGVTLKNGATITVLKGWRDPVKGKVLKRMHKAACGPFGTVLGPNSDRFHKDHLHLDTARYRSGSYCR